MYKAIGGEAKFVKTSMEVTGAPGKPAMSVPFLAQTWDMLYNKAMFKKAGLTPPRTWTQFYADAKKLNDPKKGVYAVANDFGSNSGMQTWLWIMARQNGGNLYNSSGQPDFTSNGDVKSMTQMVEWLYPDEILNPANVADTTGTLALTEFETGKAAMLFLQSPTIPKTPPGGYGLSYIPLPAHVPPGGAKVMSHIAGENLAIFKGSKHLSEDLEFIKFLTSTQENADVNQKMDELPVTYAALHTPYFQTPTEKIFGHILTTYAAPMPTEASSATAFEDYAGTFIKLCRQDITQHGISESQVRSALASAQATVAAAGG
jgi:multiple sugar transport system substrate-binding protein